MKAKEEIEIEYIALKFLDKKRVGITEEILTTILRNDFPLHQIQDLLIDFKKKGYYRLENNEIKFQRDGESRYNFFETTIQRHYNSLANQERLASQQNKSGDTIIIEKVENHGIQSFGGSNIQHAMSHPTNTQPTPISRFMRFVKFISENKITSALITAGVLGLVEILRRTYNWW